MAQNSHPESAESKALKLLYCGIVVPDAPVFRNPAYSRSGAHFQEQLLKSLAEHGADVEIVSVQPEPSFPNGESLFISRREVEIGGIRARLYPYINVVLLKHLCAAFWVNCRVIFKCLLGYRKRLVILFYNLGCPPAVLTIPLCKLLKVPFFCFANDIEVPGETVPNTVLRRIEFAIERYCLTKVDGLVTVSSHIAQDFRPGKDYLLMEGGIEAARYNFPRPEPKTDSTDSPFTIFFAGSFTDLNGLPIILRALREHPEWPVKFRLAGRGKYLAEVERYAREDKRLEYLGFLSFDDVQKQYRHVDLLLNLRVTKEINTRYFFPFKFLEYLASGVPVLTTKFAHIGDEFRDFVFFLNEETHFGLRDAIEAVRSLPTEVRRARAVSAANYVRESKSWSAQAKRVLQFIGDHVRRTSSKQLTLR